MLIKHFFYNEKKNIRKRYEIFNEFCKLIIAINLIGFLLHFYYQKNSKTFLKDEILLTNLNTFAKLF